LSVGVDESCKFFTLKDGTFTETESVKANFGDDEAHYLKTIQYSKSGDHLVTGGTDGLVRVWNCKQLKDPIELKRGKEEIDSATFNEKGDLVLAACRGAIYLWEWKSPEKVKVIQTKDVNHGADFTFRNAL